MTAYKLARPVLRSAGRRQGVPAERISFVGALRWLAEARAGDELPRRKGVPDRPGRAEPRVRERRPKQFPVMRKPRHELRQALFDEHDAA